MKPVRPVWMDVQNGKAYPVFDVLRGSGTNGRFTFPDQAANPYRNGGALNEWKLPYDATLVATAGHLHPGGLYDDLMAVRPGDRRVREQARTGAGRRAELGAAVPLPRALLRTSERPPRGTWR